MYPTSLNERYLDEIIEGLRRGEVIVYPTDTAYAVGCDALNNRAVERVCRLKGINPDKQRLSAVCSGLSQASEYARIDNGAFALMKAHLPGAFTFILPATPRLAKAYKGRREVGIRVPANAIATALAERLGNPLMSATAAWEDMEDGDNGNPEALEEHYGEQIDALVHGGDIDMPSESTIVSLLDSAEPEILRQGVGEL